MDEVKTIARYAESCGYATKAVSAEVAARCTGNSETATALKTARKITFSGDSEAEANFDGAADLIIDVKNKSAEKATCDELGNNILETYATKTELENFATKTEIETCATKTELENCAKKEELSEYARLEAVAAVCASRKELTDYLAKSDFNFSFEKFNGVPCLFIEVEGKKYRFSGVEV